MTPFLETISSDLRSVLEGRCLERRYPSGKVIFLEGDEPKFLPIVRDGRVKLVRQPDDGKEMIIGMFSRGEVFAIPPALDGKRFPATAIAMEQTDLLQLPVGELKGLLDESDEFSGLIMNAMCGILRDRAETVRIHNTPSSEARVATVLLNLVEESRQKLPVKIVLRRQDIAEIAGITTETCIRAIRKMHRNGLLRIDRGKIFIDDRASLESLLT
ncbi:MAG: Crp/Fnr family transcriptional regulator [Acidobacteria bacterium]|nr:MAG: Crp/Fnr family transcriptional regulator [Acidobacteriota bacterium]REJ99026.1 MAG: Crp/Fnr family transcriptional regulator [Acidobacteriota bacterium]REK16253.1 MAG: Crp/Fnr family transcriptional regulator [Acidobacteriota bacterium]REK43934.1 MAG: Crp/Fnr family transcriptional regulator [Acidobacteriota bacterium]